MPTPKVPTVPFVPPTPSARERLATNLIALRTEHGWNQEDLANAGGFHRTFITQIERQTRNVTLDNLERIAVTLGIPLARLLE